METIVTVLHVFVGLVLIVVVLLQTGKGDAMGAAFGGSSQTVFGASGAGNFLTKFTTGAAIVFMLTSLTLSSLSSHRKKTSVVTPGQTQAEEESQSPLPVIPTGPMGEKKTSSGSPEPAVAGVVHATAPSDRGTAKKDTPVSAKTSAGDTSD